MAKAKAWEVTDEFWSRVEPLIHLSILREPQARRTNSIRQRLVPRSRIWRGGIHPGEIDEEADTQRGENRQRHQPQ